MSFRAFCLTLLFLPVPLLSWSQSVNAPLNEDYYHWIDRYEIKSGRISPELFTTIKPYKRAWIVDYMDSLESRSSVFSSRSDQFNYNYLRNDSWEWSHAETNNSRKPFLKHLYKKKSDLVFVDIPDLNLHVNPVLYLAVGSDSRLDDPIWTNTRGIEIRGIVDEKIGFYTFIGENQSVLPSYVTDVVSQYNVIPHEGFWKDFKDDGVDFFQARAYIDFNVSKHIYMQLGHDRTFIGNGYRSLIFSDYAPPQLYLRTNVKIWKLNYLFQLNHMAADVTSSGGQPYPEKFSAFHHFSINIGKKFNLGLFESVVFADSTGSGGFELNYLNPLIFYRAIEQQFGSSDNVIVGLDYKWNAVKNLSFYGQFILDEFVLDEIKAGDGWWANKFGLQTGLKYIDVAKIKNLDFQLELNMVRPYTYSHNTKYSEFSNYRQAIAHPLGANFREWVAILRYQPVPKINLIVKSFFAKTGRDSTGVNFGGDILKDNSTRESDYDNKIGQGSPNDIAFFDFTVSYQFRHNVFIDLKQIIRRSESPLSFYNQNTSVTSLALRWNIPQRLYDF
ncbi:MAG: hypothetical protein HC811_05490 [Flammeovirgaceae bacterium]|nr:hypothetical protein [Flammeovirgaceae bacterium]